MTAPDRQDDRPALAELLLAVRRSGRGFRLDGDSLVLVPTTPLPMPLDPATIDSLRQRKGEIIAVLRSPLVAHAVATFGGQAVELEGPGDPGLASIKRQAVLSSRHPAPAPAAAHTGDPER